MMDDPYFFLTQQDIKTMDANTFKVDLEHARELVLDTFKAGKVPMLVSSPGLGKSSLAKQIAAKYNLKLIDIRLSQCDPADLNGFPFLNPETGRAGYKPMDFWPLEGDPLPVNPKTGKKYEGWLILLDEINSASKAVEVASYKILLDRMVGMHKLHEKVWLMGAGNKKTDKAVVNASGTAQQSRMIWIEIFACLKTFLKWADANGIDHRIKSFLQFKPDLLHKFDPNHQDYTFPAPRTWHFKSDIIKAWPDEIPERKLPLLAGTVGAGPAREFFAYTQIYEEIPQIPDILKDPKNVHFGDDPSMHYALAGLVAENLNANNAEPLFVFIRRLAADFQVAAVRSAIARDKTIRKLEAFRNWYTEKSWELVY
jgi:hypothetical protein